jgi:hypothetical protein
MLDLGQAVDAMNQQGIATDGRAPGPGPIGRIEAQSGIRAATRSHAFSRRTPLIQPLTLLLLMAGNQAMVRGRLID